MRALILTVAVFVGGCYSASEPIDPEDWYHMQSAREAWIAVGLPDPGDCLDNIEIVTLDWATFDDEFGASFVGFATGNTIFLRAEYSGDTRYNVLRHETMHHLAACTTGYYDGGHDNPLIWREAIQVAYDISRHGALGW